MTTSGYREEVFNVLLAQLLDEQGVVSAPEQVMQRLTQGRRMPDVLVLFHGLRTIIEGKVDDQPGAANQVLEDAHKRVDEGIAHIAIAVLYSAHLRQVPFRELKNALARARLHISICSEAGDSGWTEADINGLGDLLRRTYDQLIQEDVVAQAVAALGAGVDRFAQAVAGLPGVIERCSTVLGIGELPRPTSNTPTGAEE